MASEKDVVVHKLETRCRRLRDEGVVNGICKEDMKKFLLSYDNGKTRGWNVVLFPMLAAVVGVALLAVVPNSNVYRTLVCQRCLLRNNFLIMEISRPLCDCKMVCAGASGVHFISQDGDFNESLLYSGRPMVAREAAINYTAISIFDFIFFRDLYEGVSGALDSVDEECQFFPFRTEFSSLREALAMSIERASMKDGERTWYIGWSNCHPEVSAILRRYYARPGFLPRDSESSAIDWVFMGWPGPGSSLHLDYVQRPSFQVQLSGKKRWRLVPTPECESECGSFEFTVAKGDVVLIDTNQWYHDTYVEPGEMSITVGSEYD